MNTSLLTTLFLLLNVFLSIKLFASSGVVANIEKKGFRNVQVIENTSTGEVVAYYAYFRERNNIGIAFIDTELNLLNKEILPDDKHAEISDVVFNGKDILVSVFNISRSRISRRAQKKGNKPFFVSVSLYAFDMQGNRIGTKQIHHSVIGDGFISIYPSNSDHTFYIVKPENESFELAKVDENLSQKWKSYFIAKRGASHCETVFCSNDMLLLVVKDKPKKLSKTIYTKLVSLNNASGETMFETLLYDDEITAIPSEILLDDDDNIIATGEFFKGKKERNVNSSGIFIKKISPVGEDISYNKQTWKDGIQKQMKGSRLAQVSKSKVLFHAVSPSANGGYQVIGETFSSSRALLRKYIGYGKMFKYIKAISSGRYVGQAMYNYFPGSLTTQDFVIFNFDDELSLADVSVINKDYTKVFTYSPIDMYSGLRKAKSVSSKGFFDYAFMQKSADESQNILVYESRFQKQPYYAVVSFEEGIPSETKKIYLDKIETSEQCIKRKHTGCLKASSGNLLVYYFSKKNLDETGKRIKGRNKGKIYMHYRSLE